MVVRFAAREWPRPKPSVWYGVEAGWPLDCGGASAGGGLPLIRTILLARWPWNFLSSCSPALEILQCQVSQHLWRGACRRRISCINMNIDAHTMVFSLSSGPPNLIHNFLTSERPQALSPGRGSAACLEQSSLPYSSCCFGVRSFLLGPHGRFPLARALPSSLRKAA